MADFQKNLVYSKNDVITFPSGLPGFEKNTAFVLVSVPEYAPFEWLVCVDGAPLRFAVINPLLFRSDYSPRIIKEQFEELDIRKPEDVLLFAIVTIQDNPLESTANLAGPVLINKTRRIGKQIIVEDDTYTTQELILRKQ